MASVLRGRLIGLIEPLLNGTRATSWSSSNMRPAGAMRSCASISTARKRMLRTVTTEQKKRRAPSARHAERGGRRSRMGARRSGRAASGSRTANG